MCGTIHEDAFRAANQFGYVVRRPKGVAGLITPWNAPFMLATWKLAPCLAAGCTVVLKPAELTPLTASLFPEIVEEAGLPPGCSTSCTASARRPARRSSPIRGCR